MNILRCIGHAVFALLLLTSVSGVSVHQHLCRGEVMSTSLLPASPACMPAASVCTDKENLPPTGGHRLEQPCCDDLVQRFQVEDEFQSVSLSLVPDCQRLIVTIPEATHSGVQQTVGLPLACHSPPFPASGDLLAWNQVFRL